MNSTGIVGYRNVTEQDKKAMNDIKMIENMTGELLQSIADSVRVDSALMQRAAEHLQIGFMLAVRSVAQPASALQP